MPTPLDSFSFRVLCSTFEDSIDMTKLEHDSDTMLDEHDSIQLYNIVHLEHKLLWRWCVLPKTPHTNVFNYKQRFISSWRGNSKFKFYKLID